jgi:hypothetical protein
MIRVAVAAALLGIGLSQQSDGVIRLRPREFPQLPVAVRRDLERRGCTIPQYPGKTAPHNVISGSFIANGSADWAVLCSVKQRSRILVYRSGSISRVDSLASRNDVAYLQRNEQGVTEFSRKIDLATPKDIADYAKAHREPKQPLLNHDGIDDSHAGQASELWFLSRGKWTQLQVADSP